MNKQWIGDDHDVRKFCLLKFLTDFLKTGVYICWMNTSSQSDPKDDIPLSEEYANISNMLQSYRNESIHDTRTIEDYSKKIDEIIVCKNYTDAIKQENRENWFDSFLTEYEKIKKDYALVFIDPDTGIQRKSNIPIKERIRYINWEEINKVKNEADYVLVYQHGQMGSITSRYNAIDEKYKQLAKDEKYEIIVFLGGLSENSNGTKERDFKEAYFLIVTKDIFYQDRMDELKNRMDELKKMFNDDFQNTPGFLSLYSPDEKK